MSGKTLSNGTLSLRFMQNAQRAKLQAQVAAEQAKIKDEAEWEVSEEVKEAWGIGSESHAEHNVAYEASYLPFLFPSAGDSAEASSSTPTTHTPVVRGRRTFDERGREVAQLEKPAEGEDGKKSNEETDPERSRPKRPVAISGFRAPAKDAKKPRSKTAQMLIREDAAVRPPVSLSSPSGQGSGFVKPAGFDDLVPSSATASASLKRDRGKDPALDPRTSETKKRKKKEIS